MNNMKLYDQFSPFNLGFDDIFSFLDRVSHKSTSYPPYNIVKTGDNKFLLELAVAGFLPEDLSVTEERGRLVVSGSHRATHEEDADRKVLHQGIATRDFKHEFALQENVKVVSSNMKHGILYIHLEKEIPEEHKPKQIQIET